MSKTNAQRTIKLISFLLIPFAFLTSCGYVENEVMASGKLIETSTIPPATPTPTPTPTPIEIPTPTPIPTPEPTPTVIRVNSPYGENVERWRVHVRGALAEYGLSDEEDRFMGVMWCESRGDPNAVNAESGASGLMQHIPRYWDDRARLSGFQGASPFNPIANIYASVWLLDVGGWSHWECK